MYYKTSRPSAPNEIVFKHTSDAAIHYITSTQLCMHHMQKCHTLAFVYAGALLVHDGEKELLTGAGKAVFIRKNHRIKLTITPVDEENIKVVFILLERDFLLKFYEEIDKKLLPDVGISFPESFLTIGSTVGLESLFSSLVPYIDSAYSPAGKILELKLNETIYVLLTADKRIAATLFDFAEPWKIDILDFLNSNFVYDLSLKEMALYTGRSVATFKEILKK